MKITRKIIDEWISTFREAGSKALFGREVVTFFDSHKIGINVIQDEINRLKLTDYKQLSGNAKLLIDTYDQLMFERKCAIEEDLAESNTGMLHLSKATLGNSEKSEVKVESDSIADILKNG